MCVILGFWYLLLKHPQNEQKKHKRVNGEIPGWYHYKKGGIPFGKV